MSDLYDRDMRANAGLQKLRFFPQAVVGGKGARLRTDDGRWLLDLSASWGAVSLGHGHPALVRAVTAAVAYPAGASVLSSATGPATVLAERLLALWPGAEDRRVWLGHSGSDAMEAAVRAARRATGRQGIIAFSGAYHGCTTGTIAVSGHQSLGGDRAAGLIQIRFPDASRGEDGAAILADLSRRLDAAPDSVAACLIEPIQADGGMVVPPPGFLSALAALCRRHGILVIADEVKVGLCRTGATHAHTAEGFAPDILVLGKGLGGGLPLSAVIGPAAVMDGATAFAMQTLHGNPVCAAAGLAVLEVMQHDRLAEQAAARGDQLKAALTRLKARHPIIASVRGRGLALGIELAHGPDRRPAAAETARLVWRAHDLGLVVYYVGTGSNVLELTPPLTLSSAEAEEAVAFLGQAFDDLAEGRIPDDAAAGFAGW